MYGSLAVDLPPLNYMCYYSVSDAEELPKIPPPKRRPRLSYIPPLDKKTVDMTEERLMQDFPKHNWLFNKYSDTCAVRTQSPEKDGGSKIKQKVGLFGDSSSLRVDMTPNPTFL